MDNEHSDVRNALIDPKLLLAATTLVLAAGLGTYKSLGGLGRLTQFGTQSKDALTNASNHLNSQANHHSDGTLAGDKKKRAKDRRKRTPLPKLQKSALLSPSSSTPQSPMQAKKVIRQPSALGGARKQRQVHEESFSEFGGSMAESSHQAESSKIIVPEDIPLPPSPQSVSATSSPSTSTTPLTPPSVAVTQLPLPTLAPESSSGWHWAQASDNANLKPLDQKGPLLPEQPQSRGRKRRAKSPGVPLTIQKSVDGGPSSPVRITPFPTLNTLPPPNTPLDAQIEFMRQQVESSRAHENAARAREDELLCEVQRAREEMDRARKDVEGLRWQLGEMGQREERLIAQLNALTMHMQSMGMGIPVPVYSPQQQQQHTPSSQPIPMPLPPYHASSPHLYYHPHAYGHYARASPAITPVPIPSGVPMPMPMPPTPTSLVSPTLVHPLLSVPLSTSASGSAGSGSGSAAASEGGEEADPEGPVISYGLVEAIFKRPETYASVSRSRGRDSRASTRGGLESRASDASGSGVNEGRASGKASENDVNSRGTRSPASSSSVSGHEFADAEHAYAVSSGIVDAFERGRGRDPIQVIYESSSSGLAHLPRDPAIHASEVQEVEQGKDAEQPDEDDMPTPGHDQALRSVTEEDAMPDHVQDATAPGVQVFY
ncbi:hypothetical protein M408DRAFT_331455 [Serendipita vermifera MAFF 305830]|uniref:Uncharacterized protein n=1 Tax=Serendipita vermifera MAFF 305830 TaxID=933852 RepID=A0A0C2WEW5_SERVB|nr:hypothetical protein M408DRAFT_331455 [Serendipita vermifera MAFF 305830]